MQLLAMRQRRKDKKKEERKKIGIDSGAGKQNRVSVMTQLNLACPTSFWLEVVWTAEMWSLGKEILLFDWFILAESWWIASCVPDIYESCYLLGSVQSGAQTTLQTWTPTCICCAACLFVFVCEKESLMIFQDSDGLKRINIIFL